MIAAAGAAGDSAWALRLLVVTVRAREELGSQLFVSDELAQVRDALATARGNLDLVDVERITLEARNLTLSDAVARVLVAGPPPIREA